MQIPNTPLFVKTHDFVLWLLRRTQRFPKHLRHSYTLRVESKAFDFQEAILLANTLRGPSRREQLRVADGHLLCLRMLLRFAHGLEILAGNQIRYAGECLDELGRLLGAWLKGTPMPAAPTPPASGGRSSAGCGFARRLRAVSADSPSSRFRPT